jgi:hypothetical protein
VGCQAAEVGTGQQPAVGSAVAVDLVGHEALVEDGVGAVELILAGAAARLVEQAPPRRGERRVAKGRTGRRGRQVQLGRRRPLAEQRLDLLDRRRDARHDRIASFGVPDREVENIPEPPGTEVPQQADPPAESAGYAGGKQPGAWHQLVTERPKALDRRGGRCHALCAEDERLVAFRRPEHHRQVPAGAVQVRLDDLQHEARGARRVERVPAALEHRHAGRGGEPVRRRHRAERPAQLGPRGERATRDGRRRSA